MDLPLIILIKTSEISKILSMMQNYIKILIITTFIPFFFSLYNVFMYFCTEMMNCYETGIFN